LTFGTVPSYNGTTTHRVIKWPGLYNGAGGLWKDDTFTEVTVPAETCDNFWQMVTAVNTNCNDTHPVRNPVEK
jgi:hypothetical protein